MKPFSKVIFTHTRLLATAILLVVTGGTLLAQNLSPLDFGLRKAETGAERAEILYNVHSEALKKGVDVDYSGIDSIDIEIVKGFKSIPLTPHSDFSGVVFNVRNDYKHYVSLFSMTQETTPIAIDKKSIDAGDFAQYKELEHGLHLLIVQDDSLWVDNRTGRDYGHTRKEVLLVEEGKSHNQVIAPYDNDESSPNCSFVEVSSAEKQVSNVTINRLTESTRTTYCFLVQFQNNIHFENIEINTPDSKLQGDRAIYVLSSTNVTFMDITFNGTCSQADQWGYGISMNNVWNILGKGIKCKATWHIFGNNNISDIRLEDCALNGFDIHCYGKNISMSNCMLSSDGRTWYCGGASIYGTIAFEKCQFTNVTPFSYGNTYKTAVPSELIFKDCIVNMTKKEYSIFTAALLGGEHNPRKGLYQMNLPNITINGMTINVPSDVKRIYLYNLGNSPEKAGSLGYVSRININGLTIHSENAKSPAMFSIANKAVRTDNDINCEITGLKSSCTVNTLALSSNKSNTVMLNNSNIKVKKGNNSRVRITSRNSVIVKVK